MYNQPYMDKKMNGKGIIFCLANFFLAIIFPLYAEAPTEIDQKQTCTHGSKKEQLLPTTAQ